MSDTTYKSKVGYKSPIKLDYHDGTPEIKIVMDHQRDFNGKILDQVEEYVVARCSVAVGAKIDREELIKALRYDRGQYEKGYDDGKRDAIEALQAEQKKTVTQIFGEEQQEWEEYCTGLMNRIKELNAKVADYEDTLKWHQKEFAELRAMIDDANARLEVGKAGNKFTLNAPEQPHWVSVFDDLPMHNAVVVVSDGKRSWDVGQYHFLFKADDRTIWWWKKHTTRKVLWWMYKEDALPQPPHEVQE